MCLRHICKGFLLPFYGLFFFCPYLLCLVRFCLSCALCGRSHAHLQ
ncbi:hypothetical protein [Clostridium phage Saumur]|nr:hypothetical protein [Clostridium phage Saumur]